MQSQIDWLTEWVRLLSKKQFGLSLGKVVSEELMDQIGMVFNEAEYTAGIAAKSEKITVKEYTWRSGSLKDVIPDSFVLPESIVHIMTHAVQNRRRHGQGDRSV